LLWGFLRGSPPALSCESGRAGVLSETSQPVIVKTSHLVGQIHLRTIPSFTLYVGGVNQPL